jgi:ornithine cyclodeaminase
VVVRLIDVATVRRWLREEGIASVLRIVSARVADDFSRWDAFDKTPRIASHSRTGVIELMPISDGDTYAFKYVNGHPLNPARGLQTVTAFGVLADVATGYPMLLSEMTILTAIRTAAVSAAVAALLARSDSDTMAMIGTGSQAAFQALAFRELLGIRRLRVWDTDPAALDTFSAHARGLGFELYQATSASDAATGADIITTCTADKRNARVLDSVDVAPGVHVNAVGGDCPGKTELDPAILERGDVFVEYAPQTRIEGEIQHQAPDFPVTEVWRVFRGEAPGRTTEEQITVFDSVGFALADFSMLHVLADAAAARDLGTLIDLTADPDDPKDLFALVAPAPVPTR